MKQIPLLLLLASAGVLGAGASAGLSTPNTVVRVPTNHLSNPAAQNKKLVQRYFAEAWNQGRLAVLDTLLNKHYINHTPSTPNPPPGPEGLKPIVAAIRRAFPDLHYEIQDLVVNNSMAVARVIMTGTQLDSLFDLPATGKKISVNQINIEKIRNGKIVEHWRVTDELSLMKQLGFVK